MWLSIVIPILLSILVIVCVLLTLVVLMQRPKNEGLGAAFGSSMTENIFGAQTATVLTKATVYLGCIFFGITLLLTVLTARQSMERRVGVLENEVRKAAVLPTPKTTIPPTVAGSPQASASVAASATPAVAGEPDCFCQSQRFRFANPVRHADRIRFSDHVSFSFPQRSERFLAHPGPHRGASFSRAVRFPTALDSVPQKTQASIPRKIWKRAYNLAFSNESNHGDPLRISWDDRSRAPFSRDGL